MKDSVGIVRTRHYTFAEGRDDLKLASGNTLGPVTLAYETYGDLNKERSNAILVCHALSGDAHAAGLRELDRAPGWWNDMIGPGKAIDTGKYFVICSNTIGGCQGSTGPASVNPASGKPYGLKFPIITIEDMVNAQKRLVEHLGIEKLLSVVGGSMGGMQALQWVASFPGCVRSAIPIATALKHSPQQIAFSEVGRQAVMADPAWNKGGYYDKPEKPKNGLAVARMVGHITYMSEESMEEKFSRRLKDKDHKPDFTADFEVEGYLHYRGDSFVKRFDANSYLYLTKALDYFDLSGGRLIPKGNKADIRFLVIAFKSDWLYPSHQSQEIVRELKMAGQDATYCEVKSTYGHDAFLLEVKEETHLIKHFLNKTFHGYDVVRGYGA